MPTKPHKPIEQYLRDYDPEGQVSSIRHEKTQFNVRGAIADFIGKHAAHGHDLLEIGGYTGWQTMAYRDQLDEPRRTVIYDWQDFRRPKVKQETEFKLVDLEKDAFPDADSTYDVIVCNQVLEHLKNIFRPLSEMCRILKPNGHLIISVPNISALHNCALVLLGRQPTTTRIMDSHVRGFTIWSMSRFLEMNNHLRIKELKGFGLHPFTSVSLPGPLRTWCHTPVWLLQKQESSLPRWDVVEKNTFSTTNY